MTVYLPAGGRNVATWVITYPLTGIVEAEIAGVWHECTTTEVEQPPGSTEPPQLLASLRVCSPTLDPPPAGDTVVPVDTLPRIRQAGTITFDEWIRLT